MLLITLSFFVGSHFFFFFFFLHIFQFETLLFIAYLLLSKHFKLTLSQENGHLNVSSFTQRVT